MNRRVPDEMKSEGTEFQTSFSPATEEDIRILLQQCRGRKFDSRRLLGVARRCRFGKPQIIICAPLLNNKPFPTLYWLTCPFLDRLCGRLEASGAVSAMEIFLQDRADEWFTYHQHYAALRLHLLGEERSHQHLVSGGVGGIEYAKGHLAVKCLHLQVGTWLGMGWHPAGSWLQDRVAPLECDGGLCG